jgi:polar amino acid transport system substrate-binding protein
MWNDVQGMRALETSADGGFRGLVKAEESNSTATTEGGSGAEAANKPELSSSQSLHGLKVITQRGWFLVKAALMTVLLSITAMPLAVLIGLMMALMKLYGKWFVSIPATCYVELVRGTPLVLQLYVIYFFPRS